MKTYLLWALSICALVARAEPLAPGDLERFKKSRYLQRVLQESYLESEGGVASVFGYNFEEFVAQNTYLNLTIYGAVTGNRGGYGIAAFGVGQRIPLSPVVDLDVRLIAGSGGGGGFKAGGGLAVQGLGGVSWRFTPGLYADARAGYLAFPNGSFRSAVVGFGLSFEFWRLELPMTL